MVKNLLLSLMLFLTGSLFSVERFTGGAAAHSGARDTALDRIMGNLNHKFGGEVPHRFYDFSYAGDVKCVEEVADLGRVAFVNFNSKLLAYRLDTSNLLWEKTFDDAQVLQVVVSNCRRYVFANLKANDRELENYEIIYNSDGSVEYLYIKSEEEEILDGTFPEGVVFKNRSWAGFNCGATRRHRVYSMSGEYQYGLGATLFDSGDGKIVMDGKKARLCTVVVDTKDLSCPQRKDFLALLEYYFWRHTTTPAITGEVPIDIKHDAGLPTFSAEPPNCEAIFNSLPEAVQRKLIEDGVVKDPVSIEIEDEAMRTRSIVAGAVVGSAVLYALFRVFGR